MRNSPMIIRHHQATGVQLPVHGFTLVELLVAVGLMVLMMTLFAQIFALATGTMRTQKGLSENDQRSRMLTTIIKGDLERRTFRSVMPFLSNTDTGDAAMFAAKDLGHRQGYFAFSENDPDNDTDDVLRFTIKVDQTGLKPGIDQSPLYGKVKTLTPITSPPLPPPGYPRNLPPGATFASVTDQRNQPESDDGISIALQAVGDNSIGMSSAAEVVYFLRAGKLYRRVLLIRNPYSGPGAPDNISSEPNFQYDYTSLNAMGMPQTLPSNSPYIDQPYPDYLSAASFPTPYHSFWNDFDYSACFEGYPKFLGVDALINTKTGTAPQFGIPKYRFGHTASAGTFDIPPREFIGSQFIGAFTHQETSDDNFNYPGGPIAVALTDDPYSKSSLTDTNQDNVIDQYSGGLRIDEDVILQNVHSFDIQVFDPLVSVGPDAGYGVKDDGAGAHHGDDDHDLVDDDNAELGWPGSDDGEWKNLGYSPPTGVIGMYSKDALQYDATQTSGYCVPQVNGHYQYRFDTWSPKSDMTNDPPFWSMRYLPAADPLSIPPENTFVGSTTGSPNINTQFRPAWQPSTSYAVGDVVFPISTARKYRFAYKCIVAGTSAASVMNAPVWPTTEGNTVLDNPTMTNPLAWQAISNWRPLRAIRIKIRYVDVPSNQMREMTLVQSLVD